MNINQRVASVVTSIILAREAHKNANRADEKAHRDIAGKMAIELAQELPKIFFGVHAIGGIQWGRIAVALAKAEEHPNNYDLALQVAAAEVTDDERIDEGAVSRLVLAVADRLEHVRASGKKRAELLG